MQTSQIRQRVMQSMNEEPRVRHWVVLARCGAGLAVVALIGLIGSTAGVHPDDVASARQTAEKLQATERQRRQASEERRDRIVQRLDRSRIAAQQAPAGTLAR